MPLAHSRRFRLAGALSAALVGALLVFPSASAASAAPAPAATATPQPFVNELHYDNDGTDTGEFIEIAGPAGTDVSGWRLVLYNGNDGGTYDTTTLPGTIPDQSDGYGTVEVDYPTNGIQNGEADGIALVDDTGLVVQFLSYEGTLTATDGPADGMTSTDIGVAESSSTPAGDSLQLTGTGSGYGDFHWVSGPDSPGDVNSGQTFGEAPPPPTQNCGDPATYIHQIQGDGDHFDPAYGGVQTVEGVVTANMFGGSYVQEEPADTDNDPATSEGIFVFGGQDTATVGSTVRVTGTVSEFHDKTEIGDVTSWQVCGSGTTTIAPTEVRFPLQEPSDLEHYEDMLVTFSQKLVVSEYYEFGRYGEITLAKPPNGWDRLYTPTAVVDPGDAANALTAEYARRTITVDDRSDDQNPRTLIHPGNGQPFTLDNRFRGGDTITGITGIMDYGFSTYRLEPTDYGTYQSVNDRPASPPDVGGTVTVASFNVLNYFVTLDRDGNRCGPHHDQDCRGANTPEEFQRQQAKIVAAISTLDADVVGLMELENTSGVDPVENLVAALNDKMGAGTYAAVHTGTIGTDAIKVGLIYQPSQVRAVGDYQILDHTDDARFNDDKNRPMLTQTFDQVSTGERFTVSVNHLKSKGSDCDDLGDPDEHDGQGNCNLTRTHAAEAIVDYLASDPTHSGDPDHLIIGDLNSYDHEDPIQALEAGGYTDEVKQTGGELAYSYVYDGQAGYLDHALSSPSLNGQVTAAEHWHINADEPSVLDYDMTFKPDPIDALYAPDAYRSSDHDPVLVGLDLGPVCTNTIGGAHRGPLVVTDGVTCLDGADVRGPVLVRPGASLIVSGSSLQGPVSATQADVIRISDSTVRGPISITGATGSVDLLGVQVRGPVSLTNNSTTTAANIAGNTIDGPLLCTGNSPPPVNRGEPNQVSGPSAGQCATL